MFSLQQLKDLFEKLKSQIPLDEKKEKILKYEAVNLISFIKIIFEYILSQNTELSVQNIELQNTNKIMSLSTTHHNTANQSNTIGGCDEHSEEITCKYCKEYEQQLQKLEADIRQHIRVEQLLKLHAENTQTKMEEVEREGSKISDKMTAINNEYAEIKKKLEEKEQEITVTLSQKQQVEKQLEQMIQKNKSLESKLLKKSSSSNININLNAIPSQQQSSHQSFIKTKCIINNKHILDSFVDDALLQDIDKSNSSKANFSSLSTAQYLQKSQEFHKQIIQTDSQGGLLNQNNLIQNNKIFESESDKIQGKDDRKHCDLQDGDSLNILKNQLTERNNSIDKYQKPYQLQPNTQRLNTVSNQVGGSRENLITKQIEEKNSLNTSNNIQKIQNNNLNNIKNQSLQQQQLQQAIQNIQNYQQPTSQIGVNVYGTIRNVQQLKRPSSTIGQRDVSSVSNNSLNISKISSINATMQQQPSNINQQQIQSNQNQQQLKQLIKQNSGLQQNNNSTINTERYQQNSNRTKIPKHNSSVQQFTGNNTINVSYIQGNNTSSHTHNLSHHNLNSTISNVSTQSHFKPSSVSSNSNTTSKQGTLTSAQQKLYENTQNIQTYNKLQSNAGVTQTVNVNNYVNPQNTQKAQSPQKIFSSRQPQTNQNVCDTDRERNPSNGRQNTNGGVQQNNTQQNTQKTQNNQKSYEKLRAFMNSPKFKTDDELQNNTRSQSMDGQTSYRNMNQQNTQRNKNNTQQQNHTKAYQKNTIQQAQCNYQINPSLNNNNQNQSQLNSTNQNRNNF